MDVDLTGAMWRKSTYSNGSGGNCVEAATTPGGHPALRDSKNPGGPALVFTTRQWHTFIHGIKLSAPWYLTRPAAPSAAREACAQSPLSR